MTDPSWPHHLLLGINFHHGGKGPPQAHEHSDPSIPSTLVPQIHILLKHKMHASHHDIPNSQEMKFLQSHNKKIRREHMHTKDLNAHLSKDDTWMVSKYIQKWWAFCQLKILGKWWTLLSTKALQIKNSMSYYYIPVWEQPKWKRMAMWWGLVTKIPRAIHLVKCS